VNGVIDGLSMNEQKVLEAYDICSILVVPLHLQGEFWGFISYDDCHAKRVFSDDDVDLLQSASLLMINAIRRSEILSELIVAREDAISNARAKSDFLSNMSHEIRTPLNAVIGMTSIGKSAEDVERKDYAFERIEDASTHLLGVINDILDMSKIDAKKMELSLIDFNFEKMLRRVVNVINFRVDEKHQKLTVNIDEKIPYMLHGDDQRLAQVVTNLLSNSVKFTPENGAIHLETTFIQQTEEICTLQIAVSDTGIGITPEQQTKLFSSFQQAESGTSRKFGGTGLGLSISKHIIEMMGGEIKVESKINKGSTFSFTVPLQRVKDESKPRLFAEGVNLKNLRALAVDDDPSVCEYFREISNRVGVSIDTAQSADEALRRIDAQGAYDLYFIDLRMPGMDGLELSQRIKSESKQGSVIVMISTTEWNTIEDEAKKAGVDTFLSKPLFPSAIVDVVNECFGISAMRYDVRTSEEGRFEGYRLLLAEDVEINREIVLALLEPTGLQVDCAENGAQALHMFREAPEKYDLIFMDIQMPEMDGYEATVAIRALDLPFANTIPIIAMTANVFKEDIEQCIAAGMNDHVGKPLDFDEVRELLHRYLPRHSRLR
jgi:signal transduction histidine kinase/DNA-binding response OmpR family regulator